MRGVVTDEIKLDAAWQRLARATSVKDYDIPTVLIKVERRMTKQNLVGVPTISCVRRYFRRLIASKARKIRFQVSAPSSSTRVMQGGKQRN